jgi:hypothetical protein
MAMDVTFLAVQIMAWFMSHTNIAPCFAFQVLNITLSLHFLFLLITSSHLPAINVNQFQLDTYSLITYPSPLLWEIFFVRLHG